MLLNLLWLNKHRGGQIMSEHKMTSKDKLALGITLAAIFAGVFGLGFIGLIVNLSSYENKNQTNYKNLKTFHILIN